MKPDIYKSIYSDKNRDVFLNYLKNNISPNSNILEIGPGPGLSTNLIKPYAKILTLVEPDKEYFKFLKENYKEENILLFNCYLNETPLVKYDSIIMVFNVLNHIPFNNIEQFIKDLKSRSKKNTKIYFDMYNSECVKRIPPKEVLRSLSNGNTLKIQPKLEENLLTLNYSISGNSVERMKLYLYDISDLIEKFSDFGFSLTKNFLTGRNGDSYFIEFFGSYE